VEGPAISDDAQELYYHKREGDKFRLYKVIRDVDRQLPRKPRPVVGELHKPNKNGKWDLPFQ